MIKFFLNKHEHVHVIYLYMNLTNHIFQRNYLFHFFVNYWHRVLWYFFTVFLHVCGVEVNSPLSLDIVYNLFLLLIRWPEVYELYWSYEPVLDFANFFLLIICFQFHWFMFQILLYIFFNLLSLGSYCIYSFSNLFR